MRRIIHQYIAVSQDLADWLVSTVGVAPERVRQIYNGVDVTRFSPRGARPAVCAGAAPGFLAPGSLVVGTVGRMVAVKDQATLVRAFLLLREQRPNLASRLRLLIVGDGPEREKCLALLGEGGALDAAWLPGDRSDANELLRAMDVFVLPSLAEGISNTILEAMATGLPVVATRVGGNGELVKEGETGELTLPRQAGPMAEVLGRYLEDERLRAAHGAASRRRAEERFSLEAMVTAYRDTYESVLTRRTR
jgi:sugar transferase (PEP-CTERM/EpsH1 system associated)